MRAEAAQPVLETLAAKKGAIVEAWLAGTIQSYPAHTSRFLSQEKDPFRNPVGHTLAEALPALFDQVVEGVDAARTSDILDPVLRIRAVQDFSAAQAVAFLFLLKRVMREALGDGVRCDPHGEGLAVVEARIDDMALLAFDRFMKCREQLYEIRASEARRRFHVLLRRAGLKGGTGETENRGNGDTKAPAPDAPIHRFGDGGLL
jgi:hypothetical protein